MKFEWDSDKATASLNKHGVSCQEASTIFGDDLSLTDRDPAHSTNEHRFITFGMSSENRILVVAHAERSDKIRIISARPATRAERKFYEEG